MKSFLKKGDKLVVAERSLLARSVGQIAILVDALVRVICIEEGLDRARAEGKLPGRPKGKTSSKLDGKKQEIKGFLSKGAIWSMWRGSSTCPGQR